MLRRRNKCIKNTQVRICLDIVPPETIFEFCFLISVPRAPQSFKGLALNKTAVRVSWTPPPPNVGDGIIRGYLINYTDVRYTDVSEHRVGSDVFQAVITGLTPATVYYFRAFAYTQKSVGRGGPVIALETRADGIYLFVCYCFVFYSFVCLFFIYLFCFVFFVFISIFFYLFILFRLFYFCEIIMYIYSKSKYVFLLFVLNNFILTINM